MTKTQRTPEVDDCVSRIRDRAGTAVTVALATVMLYAEGVLKNGLIEVVLLAPILWFWTGPKPTRWLQNGLVVLAALCFTIAASDFCLRFLMESQLHFSPTEMFTRKLPQLPIVGRWDPNVSLTREAYGDLAAMLGDVSLREPRQIVFGIDAAGFRNGDTPNPIEVLVLGDSFGAGSGTTQGKTASQVLRTRYGLSTYNLSFPASGPWQQYINVAIESPRLVFALHGVVLWLIYTGNDLDDEYGETWSIEGLPWQSGFHAWKVS